MNSNDAHQLLQQGRMDEAERAFESQLQRNPYDPDALNGLSMAALRHGRFAQAIALLRRALELDPGNAMTLHHLALANDAAGDSAAAMESHRKAVNARPDFHVARLFYAQALERDGQMPLAVVHYLRTLQDAQQAGRWIDPDTTPAALRPLVEHAILTVRKERARAFDALFGPIEQRFGAASLQRVHKALRIYLRQEPPQYQDPGQLPGFLYFPDLPAAPYIARENFPWIPRLEAASAAIRHELVQLLPSEQGRERVFDTDDLERVNLRGVDAVPSWNGYYFYRYGARREDNLRTCPETARQLEMLPLASVRDHAPEVLFSVFSPGTHLLPHRGVTNTRLVGHLPLLVPRDCALKVGGEEHVWMEGRTVVFDDTYEHEAWNRSDQTRVVLIFDIWNPFLTQAEQLAVAQLIESIGEFRERVEGA